MAYQTPGVDFRTRLQDWLPKLVLAPSFAVTLLFVYGFILFTVVLSFTGSATLTSVLVVSWLLVFPCTRCAWKALWPSRMSSLAATVKPSPLPTPRSLTAPMKRASWLPFVHFLVFPAKSSVLTA